MILSPLDGRCLLELLPEHGGMCQRLVLTTDAGEPLDVLAGCNAAELAAGNPWYRGAWLYPFPSRLPQGRYRWKGRDYQLPSNAPDGQSALHGFLYRLTPEVVSQHATDDSASLVVAYRYDGSQPGYPFPSAITVEYRLFSPSRLDVTLSVQNLFEDTVPVGVGWHPYFSLGGAVDDLSLRLPAGAMAELDAQLMPVGRYKPAHGFESLSRIGDLRVDNPLKLAQDTRVRAEALSGRTGIRQGRCCGRTRLRQSRRVTATCRFSFRRTGSPSRWSRSVAASMRSIPVKICSRCRRAPPASSTAGYTW